MLFKAGSRVRLEFVLRDYPFKRPQEDCLNLSRMRIRLPSDSMRSRTCGDFSSIDDGWYFVKQYESAYRFTRFAAHLLNGNAVPVAILHIAVPKHILASVREMSGDAWREFVWSNRHGRRDRLRGRGLDGHDWLAGPVCVQNTSQVERLDDKSQLRREKLANDQVAVQYWTNNDDVQDTLEDEC